MGTLKVNLDDLGSFIELLKLYGAETKNPILSDSIWNLADLLLNEESGEFIRDKFELWTDGQIKFNNNER